MRANIGNFKLVATRTGMVLVNHGLILPNLAFNMKGSC